MGLHQHHTHGRVFRGLEAREQLQIRRRDSHGDTIKMHVPEGFEEKATEDDVQTAVSVVYVTLPQTFSGPAVYSTMTGGVDATPTSQAVAATSTAESSSANDAEASYESAKSAAQAVNTATSTPTSIATVTPQESSSASQVSAMTTLATAAASFASAGLSASSSTTGNAATVMVGSPIAATRSGSASATAGAIQEDSSSSNGMSGGAKAGLAIGILLALALVAGLVFFCMRRKKNQNNHEEIVDEKHTSFADAGARQVEASRHRESTMTTQTERVPASVRSTRTASTAPRLSLRPVTQFLPNLGENRKSSGNALDAAAAGTLAVSEKPKSAWERRPSNSAQNPFDDAPVLSEKQARPESPPSNPFDEAEGKKSSESQQSAGSTAAGVAAAATASKHTHKSSWEGTEPPTPKSAKFGTAAAVPVAAAGAAKDVSPSRGPNNVHRVQLDFKPSMDDELELRSGQLVRMLHEYDDGWALCIRMDRSQQGVAPRTCLSKLPVKPRPQGPPGSRPGTANSQRPRGPSNASPPNAVGGPMFPRPLTPTQAQATRSQSPAPAEAASQPAASVPARKPVPGQAM